jgi:hypothetical protein
MRSASTRETAAAAAMDHPDLAFQRRGVFIIQAIGPGPDQGGRVVVDSGETFGLPLV